MLRVEQRRNSFFQRWLLCFAEIPLAKSPPPLPPGILPVNEKNTSDYKSLPDTPPPSSNYKFPSESEFKLSICGERNEMWENAFFLRSALAWLLATPLNGKLAELKSLCVHVLRRARACVPVVSGFVATWGRVRALDKKGQKVGAGPSSTLKKPQVGSPYHLRPWGVVPQSWQHPLQHFSTRASGTIRESHWPSGWKKGG